MATRATRTKTERGGKLKKQRSVREQLRALEASKVERLPIPIRITPDLIDRIDEIRPDMIPREPFVRHLLDIALTQLEEEG